MKDRTVHIKCLGCQMNKLNTVLVASAPQRAGFAGNFVKVKITKTSPLTLFGDLSP